MEDNVDNKDHCIGPNVDDPSSYHAFFFSLSSHVNTTLIVGRDFGLVILTDPKPPLANADTLKGFIGPLAVKSPGSERIHLVLTCPPLVLTFRLLHHQQLTIDRHL